jgi:hypothetical protein
VSDLDENNNGIDDLKEISWLYSQLQIQVSIIAQAVLRWSIRRVGVIVEAKETPIESAKRALFEIDRVLAKLKRIEQRYRFENINLYERYMSGLSSCREDLKVMQNSLNIVWQHGRPGFKEVPFNDTTNYKFVYSHLIKYMDMANLSSGRINQKVIIFNNKNKNLKPLVILQKLIAPSWTSKLK